MNKDQALFFFESKKQTFSGVNGGDYIDREDFEAFIQSMQSTPTPPGIVQQLRDACPYKDTEEDEKLRMSGFFSRQTWNECCDTLATLSFNELDRMGKLCMEKDGQIEQRDNEILGLKEALEEKPKKSLSKEELAAICEMADNDFAAQESIMFAEFLRNHNMRPNGFHGCGGGDINTNYHGSSEIDLYKLFKKEPERTPRKARFQPSELDDYGKDPSDSEGEEGK